MEDAGELAPDIFGEWEDSREREEILKDIAELGNNNGC